MCRCAEPHPVVTFVLEETVGGGRFEAMSALADQLPVVIIAEMLGAERASRRRAEARSANIARPGEANACLVLSSGRLGVVSASRGGRVSRSRASAREQLRSRHG